MATFQYSAYGNGDTQAFDPAVDILNFDQAVIMPHDIFLVRDEDAGGSSAFDLNVAVIDGPEAGAHMYLLGMDKREITTSNFTFASGGRIFVGDNTTGMTADNSANTHVGTAFDDLFIGMGGNDNLSGGGGDDVFAFYLSAGGRYGQDVIAGGGGTDELRFLDEGSVGATVNLATGVVSGGDGDGSSGATVSGIENVAGSIFDDHFTGTTAANILVGRDGDDTLNGNGGHDTLEGGAGDDRLIGGAGRDWVDYQHALAGVDINLATGGSDGDGGTDQLLTVEHFIGSAFGDDVTGTADNNVFDVRNGADTVHAGGGEDTAFGGNGADELWGGSGADLLVGHRGNDIYWGGAGKDTMVGSGSSAFFDGATATPGRDTFRFTSASEGRDLIFAFDTSTTGTDANTDLIDLRGVFNAIGYTGTDPMADGYMRITGTAGGQGDPDQPDAVIWIDADGGGNSWIALAQVVDVSRATLLSDPDFFTFQ